MIMSVFFTTAVYFVIAKYYVAYNVCILNTTVLRNNAKISGDYLWRY